MDYTSAAVPHPIYMPLKEMRIAMKTLLYVAHRPLFRRAKTSSLGKTVDQGLRSATPYCTGCGALIVRYGRSEPDTIGAVWWKPTCDASSCSVSE